MPSIMSRARAAASSARKRAGKALSKASKAAQAVGTVGGEILRGMGGTALGGSQNLGQPKVW